jgi:hypothetical protein
MKFLAKYLNIIYDTIFLIFCIISVLALICSIVITILNAVAIKKSLFLYFGSIVPLISIFYIIFIYLALKNLSPSL